MRCVRFWLTPGSTGSGNRYSPETRSRRESGRFHGIDRDRLAQQRELRLNAESR
jgi:hypothetical protein